MRHSLALRFLALFSLTPLFPGAARAADPTPPAGAGATRKADWQHMSFDQRKKLMKTSVYPQLKKAFQAADPKRFKTFTCATCHGDGATDGKFKMPNPKLPKLPGDQAGMTELEKKKPEIFHFMESVVKPKVAGLIGVPEWTPQNPKGFGCYVCHTKR